MNAICVRLSIKTDVPTNELAAGMEAPVPDGTIQDRRGPICSIKFVSKSPRGRPLSVLSEIARAATCCLANRLTQLRRTLPRYPRGT